MMSVPGGTTVSVPIAGLPVLDLLHHLLGHVGNQRRAHLDFVDLLQLALDLARAHAAHVHRDNLIVEAREPRLALADDFRLVAAVAIPRRLQRDFSKIAFQRLGRHAIA